MTRQLVVVSGRSGSGKSTALNALEDQGFNCIDNLPVRLLPVLVADAAADERLGVCIDARSRRADFALFPDVLTVLRDDPTLDCRVAYLDASSPTLVKRFSETRRRHPLTDALTGLREAIDQESALLAELADLADLAIDTTTLQGPDLAQVIRERLAPDAPGLSLLFQSFAYRSGVPVDADFVFDARCLPNPYWQEGLRELTGRDSRLRQFLDAKPVVRAYCDDIRGFLSAWIPKFAQGGRRYLSVAVGCTGGRHRSVYVAERLAAHFQVSDGHAPNRHESSQVLLRHRELLPADFRDSRTARPVAA